MATSGVEIHHPNRERASSRATRAIVVALLGISVALLSLVLAGGWERIQGAKPMTIAWIVVYLVMMFYIARWNRGVLPVAGALAVLLAIFCGVAGPAWLDRDKPGLADPSIDESVLGMLTLLLIPIQGLLVAFTARGFLQHWNVEVEVPSGGAAGPAPRPPSKGEPAAA